MDGMVVIGGCCEATKSVPTVQAATDKLYRTTTPTHNTINTALFMAAGTSVEVPMDLIKKLRGMSGAPIMDCKKALAVRAYSV